MAARMYAPMSISMFACFDAKAGVVDIRQGPFCTVLMPHDGAIVQLEG